MYCIFSLLGSCQPFLKSVFNTECQAPHSGFWYSGSAVGAQESAFSTHSQVMLMLPVQGGTLRITATKPFLVWWGFFIFSSPALEMLLGGMHPLAFHLLIFLGSMYLSIFRQKYCVLPWIKMQSSCYPIPGHSPIHSCSLWSAQPRSMSKWEGLTVTAS